MLRIRQALLNVVLTGGSNGDPHQRRRVDAVIPEEVCYLRVGNHREEMNSLEFEIRPFPFSAEPFKARNFTQPLNLGEELRPVYDLYRNGTIIQLHHKSKKLPGSKLFERLGGLSQPSLNCIDNEFIEDVMDHRLPRPDAVVLDPPREGIHPKAVHPIIDLMPEKFVYISCNPASLVRDLEIFEQRGYKLKRGAIFDQFPRTVHCEVVALLSN